MNDIRNQADQSNQRNTKQRQIILSELRMLFSHPTAKELYHIVRKRLPQISLGTIYRNLELLAQNKTIRKIEMGGLEARFDGNLKPHHHARCVECGAIDDLFDLPEDIVQQRTMNFDNYDVYGYRIDFYGLCPRCKSKRADSGDRQAH
ncbi:MAG: transcriptional repressor [candidate division Zixibacteria bacterium]|nr:transcriptional repressor [candidate division Zixibacteria bacterium]